MKTKKSDLEEQLEFLKKKLFETQDQIHAAEKQLRDHIADQKVINETAGEVRDRCGVGTPLHDWKVKDFKRETVTTAPLWQARTPGYSYLDQGPYRHHNSNQASYECIRCRAILTISGSSY